MPFFLFYGVGDERWDGLRIGDEILNLRQILHEEQENGEVRVGNPALHFLNDNCRLREAKQTEPDLIIGGRTRKVVVVGVAVARDHRPRSVGRSEEADRADSRLPGILSPGTVTVRVEERQRLLQSLGIRGGVVRQYL